MSEKGDRGRSFGAFDIPCEGFPLPPGYPAFPTPYTSPADDTPPTEVCSVNSYVVGGYAVVVKSHGGDVLGCGILDEVQKMDRAQTLVLPAAKYRKGQRAYQAGFGDGFIRFDTFLENAFDGKIVVDIMVTDGEFNDDVPISIGGGVPVTVFDAQYQPYRGWPVRNMIAGNGISKGDGSIVQTSQELSAQDDQRDTRQLWLYYYYRALWNNETSTFERFA